TTSECASGISDFTCSALSDSRSHAYASGVRAQTPTLALPPLSPERAPMIRPSGARRVGPPGAGGSVLGATLSGETALDRGGNVTGGTAYSAPSRCTVCVISDAGATVGQESPYAPSSRG